MISVMISAVPPKVGQQRTRAPADHGEPPELNVTFSVSFFPRVLGQQEYEDEGGRQGDEADP